MILAVLAGWFLLLGEIKVWPWNYGHDWWGTFVYVNLVRSQYRELKCYFAKFCCWEWGYGSVVGYWVLCRCKISFLIAFISFCVEFACPVKRIMRRSS
ncbi:uncharacterized protein BDR25DRAFT_53659 [Lindgomyces ingoldianus]|uniref:Uncharacterized protein n=1 Tax=Lindgomyces ingoldianus TaxID=673940 RepID=A0ACB6QPR9_9PLEO|nr:uncharacterized protein BDR25DRAFT_53659 [Lindgomyces ingoldianus]KAF2468857.1 hypothetical protein BDR25DRAFT_53659 [Lindgomyces ingoldianus]